MKTLIGSIILLSLIILKQDKIIIKLESKPELFTCDNFDNVYIYTKNTLKKFNSKGKCEAQFSSLVYGNINFVDVSDPMQVTVFYKEFNTVLLLDQKLSLLGEPIHLDQLGFSSVSCVCKSKQNGIWLFDIFAQKLLLYSLNSKCLIREIDLLRYTKPLNYIENLIESGNLIYLYGKDNAILFMNQLGGKLEILEIYPSVLFQLKNNNILYTDNKNFYYYNPETSENKSLQIEGFEQFDDIKVGNEKIFILTGDSISILSKPTKF
jgi:hypothetical protein